MENTIQTTEEVTEQTEVVTPATSETTETETHETPEVEETEQQPQPELQPEAPDYRQKFVESQREAILQNERLKQKDAHISKLTTKDTPTDEEMRSLYPEWDNLDDYNKRVLTHTRQAEKRAIAAEERANALEESRRFEDSLEDFTETPPDEFKGLKGKETEFKRFAKRKVNVGLPLDTLAKAFLFDIKDEITPEHKPVLTPGLENGNGGPRTAPKPKKLSLEEASNLRKTNYREYMRLVKAGMIDDEI